MESQVFLFAFKDGRLLTKDHFVNKVRQALSLAGLDAKCYAGHSFRIGAATTAGMSGISDSTIKMLGRWESKTHLLYIRTPRDKTGKDISYNWFFPGEPHHIVVMIFGSSINSCSPHVWPLSIFCYSIQWGLMDINPG